MSKHVQEQKRRNKGGGGLRYREEKKVWVYSGEVGSDFLGNRKRMERSGRTQKEAKERFYQAAEAYDAEFLLSKPIICDLSRDMRLYDYMVVFIEKHKKRRNDEEITSASKQFYFYLVSTLRGMHDVPLCNLSPELFQFELRKVQKSKQPQYEGDTTEMSERTMIGLVALLRSAMKFAHEKRLTAMYCMEGVVRPPTKTGYKMTMNGRIKALPDHILKKMLQALESDMICKVFFYTMLATGLRSGEVRALTMDAWKREEGMFNIDKAASYAYEFDNGKITKTWTEVSTTKNTSSIRVIEYAPELNNVLDDWMEYRLKYKRIREHIEQHGDHALLIPSTMGNVYDYKALKQRVRRVLSTVDLGREESKFHRCRHTFATLLLDNQIDVKTVAEMLGHSNVLTTLNYYRTVTAEKKREAATVAMSNIFGFDENSRTIVGQGENEAICEAM